MANTWNIDAAGNVTLNGTAIPNPISVELVIKFNQQDPQFDPTTLSAADVTLAIEVQATDETQLIQNVLNVIPNPPTVASLLLYVPTKTINSQLGDTITTAAFSVVQGSNRPEKQGV